MYTNCTNVYVVRLLYLSTICACLNKIYQQITQAEPMHQGWG